MYLSSVLWGKAIRFLPLALTIKLWNSFQTLMRTDKSTESNAYVILVILKKDTWASRQMFAKCFRSLYVRNPARREKWHTTICSA